MKNMSKTSKIFTLIFFAILLLTFCFTHIYTITFKPYDELWNFQNIYKMYNGLTIYSDANVIITPIFYILGLLFFKIFGATLITFRYYNILIFILCFVLLHKLFKALNFSKHINILFLSLCFVQVFSIVNGGANYNVLYSIFVFWGILSYLKLSNKKYFHFLQGFIIFLIFFTKQNIGFYYTFSILIFEFIYRKNLKNFILNQFKKLLIFSIFLLISLSIFYFNGNLYGFINYTFGGLFNFGNSNLKIDVSPSLVLLCLIILFLYFYILSNKKIFSESILTLERRKNLHLLGCITIGITFSIFPILNTGHFLYILPFYFIILAYFLDFTILEDVFTSKKTIKFIYIISAVLILGILFKMFYSYFFETNNYIKITDSSSPFYQARISDENFKKISTMTAYIKEKNKQGIDVIIIASDSALTMVPLKQSHKEFDLVFNGNLGYDGENKLIEKIKNSQNTEFIIFTDEEDCFWQESKKIREFIIQNLQKTGEILNYSIYKLQK